LTLDLDVDPIQLVLSTALGHPKTAQSDRATSPCAGLPMPGMMPGLPGAGGQMGC